MKIDSKKYPLPKRLRHHTSPNYYLPLNEISEEMDFYPPVLSEIDWSNLFENGLPPDILDIGCAKGAFLIDYSELLPDKNFLGIELRLAPVRWLDSVVRGEKLGNCAVLWYSVANGLGFINDLSINEAFYLFPDPWTKQKHRKRRAYNLEFLKEIYRVLKSDGKLFLATDIQAVHEYHKKILKQHKGFDFIEIEEDHEWQLPHTNKEKFCRKNNIRFYRLICNKKKELK